MSTKQCFCGNTKCSAARTLEDQKIAIYTSDTGRVRVVAEQCAQALGILREASCRAMITAPQTSEFLEGEPILSPVLVVTIAIVPSHGRMARLTRGYTFLIALTLVAMVTMLLTFIYRF